MSRIKQKMIVAGIVSLAAVATASPAFAWNHWEHPIGGVKGVNLNGMTQQKADKTCRDTINQNIWLTGGAFRDTAKKQWFGVSQANNTHKWAHRSANTCVVNTGLGFFWY